MSQFTLKVTDAPITRKVTDASISAKSLMIARDRKLWDHISTHPQSLFTAGCLSRMKTASKILRLTWQGTLVRMVVPVNGGTLCSASGCEDAKCTPHMHGVFGVKVRACL